MHSGNKSIVVFTNTLLSGGAEKQALLLACTLHTTHKVLLVIYHGYKVEDKFKEIIVKENLDIVYLSGGAAAKMYTFYKLLRKHQVYIIFSYLLTTNLIGAVIGWFAGVKFRVGGIRNAQLDKKKLPVQRFIHNYLNTFTIFNNYTGLNDLTKQGFKQQNALVISNGFQLNMPVVTRPEKKVVSIITVGRFVQQKGYFIALEIAYALKQSGINFKYLIIGYGDLETQIREKITALQLQDTVDVIINPQNINSYYAAADVYLCTSFFEGLSNTIMEALSFSLPVVATSAGDNIHLVKHEVNGFIVPDMNHESFLPPLKALIQSSELRNNMGKESYEVLKANYSMQAFSEKYNDFVHQCDLKIS